MQRSILAAVLPAIAISFLPHCVAAEPSLHGKVIDLETNKPIVYVTIVLDGDEVRVSGSNGSFDFGSVAPGRHVITFEHISYKRRSIEIQWPPAQVPIVVALEPAQFMMDEIVVTGERLPVGSTSIDHPELTAAPGNIANDPLRTVQSQPSCATGGIDFLSTMAVRGGDIEEHRVYFDGYPLKHYAHVGGFSGVVYDEMLESTVLVPGAAPIRYTGNLSGAIFLTPASMDTNSRSARYDITSMAGGVSQVVGSSLSFQASAKTSFFNLPVYQRVGVRKRSFRDFLGRVQLSPGRSIRLTATLLMAMDSETGDPFVDAYAQRDVGSILSGIHCSYRASGWELILRPAYSFYDTRDALSWRAQDRTHRLAETWLHAEVVRRGLSFDLGLFGEVGTIRHSGNGGELRDTPFSASAEVRMMFRDFAFMELAVGGSREPWTSTFEPEAYGAVQIGLGDLAEVSAGYRRSHQSPFRFSERRFFASLPIDAGDLISNYTPSWEDAPAVRMDQVSAGATVKLPYRCSIGWNGFRRRYRNLLSWGWDDFPGIGEVGSEGRGHGFGYEVVLARNDPGSVSVMAAVSRARVWKREGTLVEERVGDFDRPTSWQLGISARVTDGFRISLRYMDIDGRPYTLYEKRTTPPATDEVNSLRLHSFRRLDVKFLFELTRGSVKAEVFLDLVNALKRDNIVMMYALEVSPGEFVTIRYGGTALFPIGGVTIRW
ncbi:MAG: carboxypeptidase-like regulatory domain-containing protein [bacterium]|nr:MAG: carboxypeptidase-like regulatory domain-containing protein [bacterium]